MIHQKEMMRIKRIKSKNILHKIQKNTTKHNNPKEDNKSYFEINIFLKIFVAIFCFTFLNITY